MYQLTYVSTARVGLGWAEIDRIVAASQRNNRRDNITGILVHDGYRFLHVIEGDREVVDSTYARIRADTRHLNPVIIAARGVARRQFHTWDLAIQEVATIDDCRSFAGTIEDRIAQVQDRTLRTLFSNFTRVEDMARTLLARAA